MRAYRRARREDEKTDRIEAILASARQLFIENDIEDCNLNTIAGEVGITKAALYRYFRVKELIFLELYRRELADFMPALAIAFQTPSVDKITNVILARPIFCKLSALLVDVLEKVLTPDEAIDFKSYLLTQFNPLCDQLRRQYAMPSRTVYSLLMHILSSITGCWKLCHPAPAISEILEEDEFFPLRLNFSSHLRQHMTMLLGQALPGQH